MRPFLRYRALFATVLLGCVLLISCRRDSMMSPARGEKAPVLATTDDLGQPELVTEQLPDSVKRLRSSGATGGLAPSGSMLATAQLSRLVVGGTEEDPGYHVSPIPFAPVTMEAPIQGPLCDDCSLANVVIGFDFEFYGVTRSTLNIYSNGFLAFQPITTSSGCCSGFMLPDTRNFMGVIALAWADWAPTQPGQVRYERRGTAPNRRFIVEWNAPEWETTGRVSGQVILHEGTNAIEMHTSHMHVDNPFRLITQGIAAGDTARASWADGRNRAAFALSEDAVRFSTESASENYAPVADAGGAYDAVEGQSVTLSAARSVDPNAGDVLSYAWDLENDGTYEAGSVTSTLVVPDEGTYTVGLRVTDPAGASSLATATIVATNAAPAATFSTAAEADEGSAIPLVLASATDVDADLAELSYAFDCGAGYGAFGSEATGNCTATDDGALTVKAKVRDADGGEMEYAGVVMVRNVAPVITSASSGLASPIPLVNGVATATFSTTFTDPGAADTHVITLACDGGVQASPTTCRYTAAGVYAVTVTVTDDDGGSDSEVLPYVVVYEETSAFVTGAGWIQYGASSCPVLCNGASGRAGFGFVAKQLRSTPSGSARLVIDVGPKFVSTEYSWLVVASWRAEIRGSGTMDGAGDYGFLLTAVEGSTDRFSLKIWNRANGGTEETGVVFDSGEVPLDKVRGNGSIVLRNRSSSDVTLEKSRAR